MNNSRVDYYKSGNIRGTLIFTDFMLNLASVSKKQNKNISDICYAYFEHVHVGLA